MTYHAQMPTARTMTLTALAMLAFAGNSLLCRLALKDGAIDPASFTTLRLVAGMATLWIVARWRSSGHGNGHWLSGLALFAYAAAFSFAYQSLSAATGALLLFGGLAGGLAQVLMVSSLKVAPVSAVAPFDYTQIVWASLLGWLIWSTLPTLNTLLGAALIIASGLYTAWREHRLHKNAIPATPPGE